MHSIYKKYRFKKVRIQYSPFTLLELLLVISIIAILAGLMQPALFKARERARYAKWLVAVKTLRGDPSLVGQWIFDSSAPFLNTAQGFGVDFYSPEDFNAEISSVVSTKKGRWHKEALYFNGNQNSYLSIKDGSVYSPGKEDLTVLVWFKPETKNTRYLISKGKGGRDAGWSLYQNRKLHVRARSLDRQRFRLRSKTDLEVDQWSMGALVVDNSHKEVRMYLDGKLVSSQAIRVKGQGQEQTADFTSSDDYTMIGRRSRPGGYFRGYIDEIEIFKRALTKGEIQQIYDIGSDF